MREKEREREIHPPINLTERYKPKIIELPKPEPYMPREALLAEARKEPGYYPLPEHIIDPPKIELPLFNEPYQPLGLLHKPEPYMPLKKKPLY